MLTLVFSRFVSEAMVNRSLDLGLIAKETTMFYGHKFVYLRKIDLVYVWAVRSDSMILNMFNKVFYKLHLQVKHFASCDVSAVVLNRFNEILNKLHLQVTVL